MAEEISTVGESSPIARGVTLLILAAASLLDVDLAEDTVEVAEDSEPSRMLLDSFVELLEDFCGRCISSWFLSSSSRCCLSRSLSLSFSLLITVRQF